MYINVIIQSIGESTQFSCVVVDVLFTLILSDDWRFKWGTRELCHFVQSLIHSEDQMEPA